MISEAEVRLATMADAADIAAISRDCIELGLPWRWRPGRIAKAIAHPETNVVVVGPVGAIAGFGIMRYAEEDAHLLLFAVRSGHRRRGVGSAILCWLEEVARAGGAQCIRLEVRKDNIAGRHFYWEHAYHEREIKDAMYSDVIDGICLEKWLAVT